MTTKYDDGSANWLETRFQMRMKGINLPSERVDHRQIAALRAQPITDPYIKKVVENYMAAPVYQPLHNELSTIGGADNLNQKIAVHDAQARRAGGWDSFDDTDMALQHLPPHLRGTVQNRFQQLQTGGNQPSFHGQHQQPQQHYQPQQTGPQMVRLVEGFPCFRTLNTQGFYSKFALVKNAGQTNQQLSSVEFMVRGVVKAYVVAPNQTQVDMGALERNPNLLTEFVHVEAPPMTGIGSLLVPRQCIATNQMANHQQRRVILDSPGRPQYNQQPAHLQSVVPPRQKLIQEVPMRQGGPQRILRG